MARVANELGFTTMSLYRHVDSKDQLLALMVDAASGPAPKERHQQGDWCAGLATWTRELVQVYSAHPWMVEVAISGPPMLPNQLDWMDWALAIMEATPLTPAERISTLLLLSGYARNEVQLAADLARAQVASSQSQEDADQAYSQALAALVPPDRMPALHALATTGLFGSTMTPGLDDDVFFFEFGLARILDGLEHYANERERADP
jgi:AcrR family transcriptional regulator